MQPKPNLFAQLLTESIYKIKLNNSSSISIVQDELGYAIGRSGGRSIEYWRQGNVPNKVEDVHSLLNELIQRGGLRPSQNELFLEAAGIFVQQANKAESTEAQEDELTMSHLLASSLSHVPQNNFRHLVGRQVELDKVLGFFDRTGGNKIVGIDGMGGIGKTALAIEIANQCLTQGIFSQAVWLTANKSSLNSGDNMQAFDFESVLQGIGLQLGIIETGKLDIEGKIQRIKDVFEFNSIVVILDNLETADESQSSLITKIRTFFSGQGFILTSRLRFTEELYHVHLEGLEKEESFKFLKQDASEKGIDHVSTANSFELEPVVSVVGGSPLALKLIVSQLDYLPLDQVIQDVQLSHAQVGSEYAKFYKFILHRSWQKQNRSAQELLVALACFDEAEGSNFDAIQYVTNQAASQLVPSIDSLWQASLIEVGQDSIQDIRYHLHPLTTNFVLSDIVNNQLFNN